MSVELLKTICDWGAVVLVGLTFIFGAGALITGKILSERQSAQLQKMSGDLTKAQTDLAKAQKGVLDAEAGTLQLHTELEHERQKTAILQESAAAAERELGNERHTREEDEKYFDSARNPGDPGKAIAILKQFENVHVRLEISPGNEPQTVAIFLKNIFKGARWEFVEIPVPNDPLEVGIHVSCGLKETMANEGHCGQAAEALADLLADANIGVSVTSGLVLPLHADVSELGFGSINILANSTPINTLDIRIAAKPTLAWNKRMLEIWQESKLSRRPR